jgi:acetyltransferase-like isoleucine patch superfamily enzyme/putative methionine-R-sulfoxide reductase with GAF domain
MNVQLSNFKWRRLREILVTTILKWLPTSASAVILRNHIYRTIFKRIGKAVYLQDGVEFSGTRNLEVGDRVCIYRGVRVNASENNCRISIGERVVLERGVEIGGGENCQIKIGKQTFIGPYTCIDVSGDVKSGKHCSIGDDCWLGYGVKVLDGVTIGRGSIISAGAVVTQDIPPDSVAVGVPARIISNRKPLKLVERRSALEHVHVFEDNNRLFSLSSSLSQMEMTARQSHQSAQPRARSLSSQFVVNNLLYDLLECIRQVMHVDTVTVLLRTASEQQLTVSATLGLEEEIETKVKIPIGQGFAGQIAASRELAIVYDLSQVNVFSTILRKKGLHSMLGVPLLAKERVIGVFHVGTLRPRHFTSHEAQRMQSVAGRIGLAVEPLLDWSKILI